MLKDVQQRLADMTTVAEESIVGVNVVKAFAREDDQESKFAGRTEAIFEQSVRAARQSALYLPLLGFLPLLAQGAVLIAGGHRVVSGDLSLGQFVSFNFYLLMLVFPLRMLGMWIGQIQRATAAGERIFEVLDEPQEIRDAGGACDLPAGGGRITFEGVTFGYDPALPVLEESSSTSQPGRVVALIGAHRIGEDDLDRAVAPLLRPPPRPRAARRRRRPRPDGCASCDARSASCPRIRSCSRRRCARTSPSASSSASDEAVERAARAAQAHDFIVELPDGYDTVIGERGVTLSGGQRQRIAIARALLVDPRVLILDDATASVDATTESQIRRGLREVMRGRTTLIIAHRLSTISLADEIVVAGAGTRRRPRHARRAQALEPGLPGDRGARPARRAALRGSAGGERVSGRMVNEAPFAAASLAGRHGAAGAAPVATCATRAFPTLGGECSTRHPASAYRRKCAQPCRSVPRA